MHASKQTHENTCLFHQTIIKKVCKKRSKPHAAFTSTSHNLLKQGTRDSHVHLLRRINDQHSHSFLSCNERNTNNRLKTLTHASSGRHICTYAFKRTGTQTERTKGTLTHQKVTANQHNTQKHRHRGIQTYSYASTEAHNNVGISTRTIPAYRHTVVRSSSIQAYRRTNCPTGVQKHSKSCRRLQAYGHRVKTCA